MNYYIQGDPAKAEQIKAAFEKLGIDVLDFGFADKTLVYCSIGGAVQCLPYSINLMHILYSHPDYKELELPVQHKFKVGDLLVYNNDNCFAGGLTEVQVAKVKDGVYFFASGTTGSFKFIDENCRLWAIEDAKDGDVLSAKIDGDGYILIFKRIKDGWIETYGHYYITIDKFCVPTQMFCRNYQGRLYPATQEQYRTLFKKMREAGYEWDADKKELRKIQPHYDISNFKPFDKVLVRCGNDEEWMIEFYCKYDTLVHTSPHRDYPFMGIGDSYSQCIPFEENEHLLGTTDMCDEQYINW